MPITYRLLPNFNFYELKPVLLEAADILPGGLEVLKSKGWDGFLEYYLGEGQFGPERYNLSATKRLYYQLKPILPRSLVRIARRNYRAHQENNFPLGWPIEPRLVRFLQRVWNLNSELSTLRSRATAEDGRTPWPVQCGANFIGPNSGFPNSAIRNPDSATCHLPPTTLESICPSGNDFSFVLTHDVETEKGLQCVKKLADIDAQHGFRSSFNFVPERYSINPKIRSELKERGFEIGVHGLKHDGKLFSLKKYSRNEHPESIIT